MDCDIIYCASRFCKTGLNVNQITMMQEDATLEESSWYGDKEQYVCA